MQGVIEKVDFSNDQHTKYRKTQWPEWRKVRKCKVEDGDAKDDVFVQ